MMYFATTILRSHLKNHHPSISLESRFRSRKDHSADPFERTQPRHVMNKSVVWDHFLVNVNDRAHAICRHCGKPVSRGGIKPESWTTTNLRNHLIRHHPSVSLKRRVDDRKEHTAEATQPQMWRFSQTSIVWDHFRVSVSDSSYAVCSHCGKSVSRGGIKRSSWTTTTLRNHLVRHHPSLSLDRSVSNGKDRAAETTEPRITATPERTLLWGLNDPRSLHLHRVISEMIALDNQPFSIINNPGFRRLMSVVKPRYPLPSDTYLQHTAIPELHRAIHDKLTSVIDSSRYMSFTTDMLTISSSSESVMIVTGHWIDDDWQRKSAILQTSHLPRPYTAHSICQKFSEMLNCWSLTDKVCLSLVFFSPDYYPQKTSIT